MTNRLDLELLQGSTFFHTLTWQDAAGSAINIEGYDARMQARPTFASPTVVLDLTLSGGLTVSGVQGQVLINIPASTTTSVSGGKYVYDLELESPVGVVTRLVQGVLTVSPEVTR